MKILKWLKAHPATLKDVAASTCLLGASAGIVFGVSAAFFKVQYMPLFSPEARLEAALTAQSNYYCNDLNSSWNMNPVMDGEKVIIPGLPAPKQRDLKKNPSEWHLIHPSARQGKEPWNVSAAGPSKQEGEPLTNDEIKARYDLISIVIDGSTHSTLDRSFNQSLYEGLVDYIKNKKLDHYDPANLTDPIVRNTAIAYKPAQDTTTEFINLYLSAIQNDNIIGLAGFNHSTPLNSLMTHKPQGESVDPHVSGPNTTTSQKLDETSFILVDSNVPNNQNVASVQFRSDEAGFLAAIATCQYFYNNLDLYHEHFNDLKVAEFGGVLIPTVIDYMGGYQRGVELFNYSVLGSILKRGPEYYYGEKPVTDADPWSHLGAKFENLVEHSKYKDQLKNLSGSAEFNELYKQNVYNEYSVKMIKLGDIGTHFSGGFAAGDAIGITKQYLNRGADAIIAVAGPQSLDASQEIKNQNSKCIVIGVDTPMEESDYQRFHQGCSEKNRDWPNKNDKYMDKTVDEQGNSSSEANAIIKFSALKDIKQVANKITRLTLQGFAWDVGTGLMPDPDYAICTEGYQTNGNILNSLVSISWDGFYPLIQALECIEFVDRDTNNQSDKVIIPFFEKQKENCAWAKAIKTYISKRERREQGWKWEQLPELYRNSILGGPRTMTTFNKNSDIGKVLYENYQTTIQILAELFVSPNSCISFDRTMTLEKDGNSWSILPEGKTLDLPILIWLSNNMYMIS